MVEKERFLVVVSVLEGRNFPKRHKHRLIAEARFDGELLATDPVEHVECPDFTQELAWELDKKGLHQHRMQRTSIKVQIYAKDTQSTVREPVGYVILDLRSAQSKQVIKWYSLLHSKYQKSRPEVKLGIYIDDDKGALDTSFKARSAPARAEPGGHGKFDPKVLKPVLNELEGYYQIGPKNTCADDFVMSITIAFAANLPQLIPTNTALPPSGYFFYYSLFGNDVTNEVFHDLLNPSFPAERASVKLKSSVHALKQFFTCQPGVEIHLCCGDQSLGHCEVPLSPLLKDGSTEIYMKPVTIEGAFTLVAAGGGGKSAGPPPPDELRPLIGVSVVLRMDENNAHKHSGDSLVKDAQKHASASVSPDYMAAAGLDSRSVGDAKLQEKRQAAATPPPPPAAANVSGEAQSKQKAKEAMEAGSLPGSPLPPPATRGQHTAASATGVQTAPAAGGPVAYPLEAHHFSVSIDLRSISALAHTQSANVFLRYSYPFFGSTAPILTHPPVEVLPDADSQVLLPQGFCAFDFATNPQQLRDTFVRVPLLIEVWTKDIGTKDSTLLGAAQLTLANMMAAEKARAVHSTGVHGWRQVWSERLPILTSHRSTEKLGEVYVVLSLEDWGPINVETGGGGKSAAAVAPSPVVQPVLTGAGLQQQQQQEEPRHTQEYQAALELEMWKEAQEVAFEKELKGKESQHMAVLAAEWKRRDKEREVLVQKKLTEYNHLENVLKKTLADLDKRDKQLVSNEQEVLRLKKDLEREHERKMTEMREASRRLKEDCDHQVLLEKNKSKEFEDYVAKLKSEISDQEAKYKALEREFTTYKEQINSKPEVRLQAEINLLTLEKVELERKLDAVTKSKVHYKQQWGRALKELARLKQREQTAARAALKRQQQELDHMRLRYLAAEEQEVVKAERRQLDDIKNELNMLRDSEVKPNESKSLNGSGGMYALQPDSTADSPNDEHITRLIEERDSLLRTGVYTTEDPIITELERQIREAVSNREREVQKQAIIANAQRRMSLNHVL